MTQAQVAEQLQVTERSFSRWETGIAAPGLERALELADVLETTVEELWRRVDEPTPRPIHSNDQAVELGDEKYVKPAGLAAVFGWRENITPSEARRRLRRMKIPFVHMQRMVLVSERDLLDYLEKKTKC
jgi:DNA-binding XRE family transcriptional regulator